MRRCSTAAAQWETLLDVQIPRSCERGYIEARIGAVLDFQQEPIPRS